MNLRHRHELDTLGQDIENIHRQGHDNHDNIKDYASVVQQFLQNSSGTLFTSQRQIKTTTYF